MSPFIAVLPVFLLVVVGYVLRAFSVVKQSWIKVLNGFVYYVSLPALIVNSLVKTSWQGSGIGTTLLVSLLILLITASVVILALKILPLTSKEKSVVFVGAIIPNTVYLGVPLVSRLLDQKGLILQQEIIVLLSVVLLVGGMLAALIGIEFVYLKSKNTKLIVKKFSKNPLVLAIATGLLFGLMGWPSWLNDSVGKTLEMLAQTASPVALFVLGSFLYGKSLHKKKYVVATAVAGKLIFMPAITLGVLYAFDLPMKNTEYRSLLLMAAMPTAVTAFVISDLYELDKTVTAATMLLSTAASVVLVPFLASTIL